MAQHLSTPDPASPEFAKLPRHLRRRILQAPPPAVPMKVTPQDIQGLKQLSKVALLLRHLHEVGCERDTAGNRELHYDDYVLLMLLAMFNPLLDSLRSLQHASGFDNVRQKLGITRRFSLGSFSESCRVFEPQLLDEVIAQLWTQLPAHHRPELFKNLPGQVTLVDGTVIRTLRTIAGAMWLENKAGWRLHLQFDVDRHVPSSVEITAPKNTGKSDERNVLRKKLKAGHVYVMDRWYSMFGLFNAIHKVGSNYVCRIRDHSVYEVLEKRPLSAQATAAGVVSDEVVNLGGKQPKNEPMDHPVRLVCVKCTPHEKRGKTKDSAGHSSTAGPTSDGTLRIVTDLSEVPAEIVAFLYEYRWTIEVFIRFFKQLLGNKHLLSTHSEGIQIQIAAGLICCMLMNILTGVKPTKRLLLTLNYYLSGWATLAEVQREIEEERARQARAEAKKNGN